MDQLVDTIGTIYEAAIEPGCWSDTVRSVAGFVGAERGMIGLTDVRSGSLDVSEMFGMDPEVMACWARDYDNEDPWADGMTGLAEGEVGRGSDLLSYEELERRPVFRAIAVEAGAYDTCWTAIAANRLRVGFLSVYQGEERGVFSLGCVRRMASVGPHLVRAARIHTLFAELRARTETFEAALDQLSFGIITCTRDAGVVTLNRQAEKLLGPRGVLRIDWHRLAGRSPHETERLQALVGQASSTALADGAGGGGVVRLGGSTEIDHPLAATVIPLSRRVETPFGVELPGAATALVVVANPEQALRVPEGALAELYGLTPAEARLALAVARGRSPRDYASASQISVETVRWTLKKVLAKTATDRQSALASVVLRSLGPLAVAN